MIVEGFEKRDHGLKVCLSKGDTHLQLLESCYVHDILAKTVGLTKRIGLKLEVFSFIANLSIQGKDNWKVQNSLGLKP